jgi:hypothetical protein
MMFGSHDFRKLNDIGSKNMCIIGRGIFLFKKIISAWKHAIGEKPCTISIQHSDQTLQADVAMATEVDGTREGMRLWVHRRLKNPSFVDAADTHLHIEYFVYLRFLRDVLRRLWVKNLLN